MQAASPARRWDAIAAIIAALIGVLALFVSGYTAYIQRQQVRAQVWPFLLVANFDPDHAVKVLNKGVGPAIIRAMQVRVDGTPQPDWPHVLSALGLPRATLRTSTIRDNVISAGETVGMLVFPDQESYQRYRAAESRVSLDLCYCSTLEECWTTSDRATAGPATVAARSCPVPSAAGQFND